MTNLFLPFVRDGAMRNDEEDFYLLMDRCRVHLAEEFQASVVEENGRVDYIPAGCTSMVQPLDCTIMRAFKARTRNLWKEWKRENTDEEGRCPRIPWEEVLGIVSQAWGAIAPEAIVRAWGAAGLLDGDWPGIEDLLVGENEFAEDDDGLEFFDEED